MQHRREVCAKVGNTLDVVLWRCCAKTILPVLARPCVCPTSPFIYSDYVPELLFLAVLAIFSSLRSVIVAHAYTIRAPIH